MANDDRSDPRCDADALVVRARTDRESFGQLYDLYYDRIFRYCVRRLFRRCAAEEACSEVFLYVASHLRQFRGATDREFRCWLYGIATNTINAQVRRTRRRNKLLRNAVERDTLRISEADAASQDSESLDWLVLHRTIVELDPRDQAIVTLRFFEEMSHNEIAATLGMRSGAVRVALRRALEKLRRQLAANIDASKTPRFE